MKSIYSSSPKLLLNRRRDFRYQPRLVWVDAGDCAVVPGRESCVRELPWVVDSIERLIQRNVFSPSSIFNYSAGGTVYTRAKSVVGSDGIVGAPYDALKQACYGATGSAVVGAVRNVG